MDIDNFKKINETYNHFVGDEAIKLIAKVTEKTLRQEDLFARWGGEEFVIFLSETSTDQAISIGERIRNQIKNVNLEINEEQITMTVSIGGASYNCNDQNLDDVLKRADNALHDAKHTGKNKVLFHQH